MKYNKLVRDKIPEIIKNNWELPLIHIADDIEYWDRLKNKLKEEVDEFLEDTNIYEELADIFEVLESILKFKWVSIEKIEQLKLEKRKKRWWFEGKIILDEKIEKK